APSPMTTSNASALPLPLRPFHRTKSGYTTRQVSISGKKPLNTFDNRPPWSPWRAWVRRRARNNSAQRSGDDRSCFLLDQRQVAVAQEGFRVQLVHILGTGRARGEPARRRHDLQAADRRAVARGCRERRRDRLPG